MQNLSGLKSLYALHILHFRSDDTCIWVFRELRRFIVDNVAQHPDLSLEYLALKDSISQLARNLKAPSTVSATKPKKSNSKQKASGTGHDIMPKGTGAASAGGAGTMSGKEPMSDNNGTADVAAGGSEHADDDEADDVNDEDDEDEDEDEDFLANGLKIDTIDGYRFPDLPEVKIFSREIRLAKL